MSGILDNKSRIMDTIVTLAGRQQIADGKLKVEHVSFTDAATFYQADVVSGSSDATQRIYFESCHLPQDQITFEADDSGRLKPFRNGDGIQVKDGQILEYSFNALTSSVVTGSNEGVRFLSGDEFASTAESLLASSIDNFNKLRTIATKDKVFEDDGFGVGQKDIEFTLTNDRPIANPTLHTAHINHLESLFNDVRLSHIQNFKYLPPINKVDDLSLDKQDHRATWQHHLGNYRPWGRSHIYALSPAQIEHELQHYANMHFVKVVNFDPTSRENRLLGQFFEVHHNVMKKLDVIEYGSYSIAKGHRKHIFFVGKVLTDENETHTFVHLFTLVFG
jgi:hypothetical protein